MENQIWNWFKNTKEAEQMSKCKNSSHLKQNKYHEEDNILIHTKMVYKEVIKKYKNKIDIESFFVLLMSSICHDIAKPETRSVNEDGYTKFINHENVGFYKTLSLLKKYQENGLNETCFRLTDNIITRILNIVSRHDIYKYKNNIQTLIERYQEHLPEILMFSVCDIDGRKTKLKHDISSLINIVKDGSYFKLLENYKDKSISKPKKIIFLVGPPASGKSFLSNCLFLENEYTKILSRDKMIEEINFKEFGVIDSENMTYNQKWDFLCKNDMQKDIDYLFLDKYKECIMADIETIVIDKTNTTKSSRKALLSPFYNDKHFFEKFEKYQKNAYVMAIPPETIKENSKKRASEGYKDISDSIIDSFIFRYENPDFTEFDNIKYIIDRNLTLYNKKIIL